MKKVKPIKYWPATPYNQSNHSTGIKRKKGFPERKTARAMVGKLIHQGKNRIPKPRKIRPPILMTMDFNPSRLNVVYDETTGVIRDVKCG